MNQTLRLEAEKRRECLMPEVPRQRRLGHKDLGRDSCDGHQVVLSAWDDFGVWRGRERRVLTSGHR